MRGLGAIIEALTTGSYAALETYLTDVRLTRLRMGFNSAEVIEALLLCKDAALPIIWRAYPSGSATAQELTPRWTLVCAGSSAASASCTQPRQANTCGRSRSGQR